MFILLLILFPVFASAGDSKACRSNFEHSLRHYQIQATQKHRPDSKLHPQFRSVKEEQNLEKLWNRPHGQNPTIFEKVLPLGVSMIGHRLRESQAPYMVKLVAGNTLMFRASYLAQGKPLQTNVTVALGGLLHNMTTKDRNNNWLVGPGSAGAVIFLHGGGTRSTGGHVVSSIADHLDKANIGVLSPDLSWHGEGPRQFMGDLSAEIDALSSLVKKYIHPKVPVFVWGHSWGASLAHKIMQMSGEREAGFFHDSLTGLIITSPAVDVAPGGSYQEKKTESEKRYKQAQKMKDKTAYRDLSIFTDLVYEGKSSPLGGLFTSLTISQIDDSLPQHGGDKYLPALMLVGRGDPLVYVGYEDLFEKYYGSLSNVEAHYFGEYPLLRNPREKEMVGHMLGEYVVPGTTVPVNIYHAVDFMNKHGVVTEKRSSELPPVIQALRLYSNDLAFRQYVEQAFIVQGRGTKLYLELRKEASQLYSQMNVVLARLHPKNYFREQLGKIEEKIKNLKGAGFTAWLELFETEELLGLSRFFSGYKSFLDELKGEKSAQEILDSIEAFRRQNLLDPKTKTITNEWRKAIDREDLDQFWDKYPYIKGEQKQELEELVAKVRKIEDRLNNRYAPTFGDWENSKKKQDKSPREIQQSLSIIENNLARRVKREEEKKQLTEEGRQIKSQIHQNTAIIDKHIKILKSAFTLARESVPFALREEYREHELMFEELYRLSQKLEENTNERWAYYLENDKLNSWSLEQILDPYEAMVDEYYRDMAEMGRHSKDIKEKLNSFLKDGGRIQNQDYSETIEILFGEEGVYKVTESLHIRLSRIESRYQELRIEEALDLQAYNEESPLDTVNTKELVPVKNIFSQKLEITKSGEGQGQNKLPKTVQDPYLQRIISQWQGFRSRLLPSIPPE